MHKHLIVGSYRIFFALLALAAIVTQFVLGMGNESFSIVNFFHFFTIQSNILAAIILLIAGVAALGGLTKHYYNFAMLRGAATVYMTVTGVIYVVLLSGLEASLQTPTPWVNMVLHYIMPVVVLADWLVNPPYLRIPFKKAAWWLSFPAAYGVYSLIRGHIVGWYPYPFLNPTKQGYIGVVTGFVFIIPAMILIVWLVALRSRVLRKA